MTHRPHIRIARLYTSRGHNFFGRHGKAAGTHALIEHQEIHCVAGRGVEGDRFFDYKEDHSGQITFFATEVFDDVCAKLRVTNKHPGLTRRNVITAGVDLNALIGREFALQGVRFLGVEECRPCYWMDQAIAPGAEAALRNRGGLRAKILTTGRLRADA
ncbi:MAG TPA: molybdenum cofactor biosysynthesis protein [Verrucomicrobiae bacterium]